MDQMILQWNEGLNALLDVAQLGPHDLMVVGGSTSEVLGKKIGTASSEEVAQTLLTPLFRLAKERQLDLAIQCCEHLNRALVVERETAKRWSLEIVQVKPVLHAGGALATVAYAMMEQPVVVDSLRHQGSAGIDIGNVLIGMHLRPVVVPVRTTVRTIGEATIVFARTRPRYIGGPRAEY